MKGIYKLIIAVVVLLAVGVVGWYVWQKQSDNGLANISASAGAKLTDDQVRRIVERVGKFMVLPQDEQPSVLVINNAATLAEQQAFYRDAKDGNVLIVYSTRAIIYDAKNDKLVNVGPIVRNDEPATTASGSAQLSPSPSVSPSASPVAPEKVTIDVRNGTTTAGLAGSTASDLKKNTWVTIGKLGDAKGSYTKTVLVDLSGGKKPGAIAKLQETFNTVAVTAIPKGEATSTADILVIVGKE